MDATMHGTGAVVREPGSSRATWAMGSLFEHLVESAETDGAFAMTVVTQPPGIATPLHRHTREAEMFYVLEGTLTYRAGEETFELSQGSSIFLPRGVPHAFRIRGTAPARLLALTIPGGLMGLYDEVGLPAAAHRLPGLDGHPMNVEIAHWNRVGPGYGLEVLGPPIPE
jgi:quercetin dioxygenase-like cupin family protein